MGQTAFITCNNCNLEFPAEEFVDGGCPDCGNEFTWEEDIYSGKTILIWDFKPDTSHGDEIIKQII